MEVIGTEAELLLAPQLALLDWMFKRRVSFAFQTTDATWNKWDTTDHTTSSNRKPQVPRNLESDHELARR